MAFEKCIAGLRKAAGRDLSDAEVSEIFERLHKAARDIKAGRVDVGDIELPTKDMEKAVTGNVLFEMAAERASQQLIHEAEITKKRAQLQLSRLSARRAEFDALSSKIDPLEAIKTIYARDYSGKTNVAALEPMVDGYKKYFLRRLESVWDSLGNDFLGFVQDPQKAVSLIRELRGEDSGNPMAKKGAKAFRDVAEEMRTMVNENGGDIGRLDDWAHPQHHSQEKVADAAFYVTGKRSNDPAVNKKAYADFMFPILAKTRDQGLRYVDDLGVPFSDAELRTFIEKAWDNIATNGHATQDVNAVRRGSKIANRHGEHRQIHFPDAESVIAYWGRFGERTVVEILHGHIETLARDIAFLEHSGPNHETTYRTLRNIAVKKLTTADPKATTKVEGQAQKLDQFYDYISGNTKSPADLTLHKTAAGIRNLNVAGKLGGASIASLIGDKPMMEAVAHMNNIPAFQRWQDELRILNPANSAERRMLQRQGLMLDGLRAGLNRFYDQLGGGGYGAGKAGQFAAGTGKVANAVMRMTGMNFINEVRKGVHGLGLFSAIGHEINRGLKFADLADADMRLLRNYGITEADWKIWSLAKLEDLGHGNDAALTPDAIARISDADLKKAGFEETNRRQAIVKLLGAVNTESEFAIVTPGWRERAEMYAGAQPGTWKGEIWTSVLQFKSFPWTLFKRSMDAIANQDTPASKGLMVAYLIGSTTLAGAMLMQTREMLAGKDPRAMMDEDALKFWGAAFVSGGSLGIYGDFLYNATQTRYGSGPIETMLGPTIGPLVEMGVVLPLKAAAGSMEGKETNFLAKEVARLKGFIPGNNIWYTKAALDHILWQNVMDMLSPGYLRNMERRTNKEFGQEWWWRPGELTPERGPDFGAAIDQ